MLEEKITYCYTCDLCKVVRHQLAGSLPPDGWVCVVVTDEQGPLVTAHLCSLCSQRQHSLTPWKLSEESIV